MHLFMSILTKRCFFVGLIKKCCIFRPYETLSILPHALSHTIITSFSGSFHLDTIRYILGLRLFEIPLWEEQPSASPIPVEREKEREVISELRVPEAAYAFIKYVSFG
jgi:hypothetical protein